MAACESLLNMAPVCIMSFSWVIFLSLSRINVMCHFTSSTPSKNVIELSHNMSLSNLVKSMLPGIVSCHFIVQEKVVILCQPLQYCQPLCQFVLDCSIKPISYNQFHVVDVGFIMALLRQIFSYQLQIITQESSLETTLST